MRLLRRLLYVTLALAVLFAGGVAALYFAVFAPVSTIGAVDFEQPLRIPPLARSHVTADGVRVFDLTARKGTTALSPGKPTRTWGFNQSYLGPTLRATRGEKVKVNITNQLDETTTVHWHGMHLPARFDGGPHQPITPGRTWSPRWRIDQPAATLWYHPHPEGRTAEHINWGLAGMFILGDPANRVAARLPHQYGVDDIPVIVQDRRFDGRGHLRSASGLGDDVLVDGTYGPYLDVQTRKVRLRLLNASDQRVYTFGLSGGRDFTMIGTGGGLLHQPFVTGRVQLAPGERAEIVISMTPREHLVLRSYGADLGTGPVGAHFEGGQDSFDLLQLRAADRLRPSPAIPDALAPAPDLDVTHAPTRTFDMQGRQINHMSMKMGRIDQTVPLGTEIWQVTNTGGGYHDFHVHDVQFQVLSIDGHRPAPPLSGWKDTIFMPPGRVARLAMQFTDYADPDSPYMYHCHLLDHEDRGMMGQFVVVQPGRHAGTPKSMHGSMVH